MVLGKGLDGCGVQRGAIEMMLWAKRHGHKYDIFYVDERGFARGYKHGKLDFKRMKVPDFRTHADNIDKNYDVVVLNSYPSAKHTHACVHGFYHDFVKRINRPVIVGMMHEITKQMIDRIPMLFLILNRCDVVRCFSEKTWFANEFKKYFPRKRVERFRIWTSLPELDALRLKHADRPRLKRLLYMGRWTTMKDPRRCLELAPILERLDPEFDVRLIGIEKSVGAKFDVIVHPRCEYYKYPTPDKLALTPQPGKSLAYGPYAYDVGLDQMTQSMFGASFYQLPKSPENYGDRMEYTQIEMISVGSIPVFDKNFGENNYTPDGKRFIDEWALAVWSDKYDLEWTAAVLHSLSLDPAMQKQYRDSSYEFVRQNFNADVILPDFFESALKAGKTSDVMEDRDLLTGVYCSSESADYAIREFEGKSFPLSFKEAETRTVNRFVGTMHKREEARVVTKVDSVPAVTLGDYF